MEVGTQEAYAIYTRQKGKFVMVYVDDAWNKGRIDDKS